MARPQCDTPPLCFYWPILVSGPGVEISIVAQWIQSNFLVYGWGRGRRYIIIYSFDERNADQGLNSRV